MVEIFGSRDLVLDGQSVSGETDQSSRDLTNGNEEAKYLNVFAKKKKLKSQKLKTEKTQEKTQIKNLPNIPVDFFNFNNLVSSSNQKLQTKIDNQKRTSKDQKNNKKTCTKTTRSHPAKRTTKNCKNVKKLKKTCKNKLF